MDICFVLKAAKKLIIDAKSNTYVSLFIKLKIKGEEEGAYIPCKDVGKKE